METQTSASRKLLKPFSCTYSLCKRTFGDQKELVEHLKAHRLNKQATPKNLCKSDLNDNLSHLYSEEKLYRCETCDQAFSQISNLRRHERVHKGERPYECEICHKRFSTSSNHKQHMLVHQEKDNRSKFLCEICQTSYFYKASLKKHMRSHQQDADETREAPKQKEKDVQPVSKKIFVTPTTNIEIPTFDSQGLCFDDEKKKELIEFWEMNNNEYLRQNPIITPELLPMMMILNAQNTLKSYEYLLNMVYNTQRTESFEVKDSSDTLSNSSRVSKDKQSSPQHKLELLTDDADHTTAHPATTQLTGICQTQPNGNDYTVTSVSSTFGAGIIIPRPIRPQRI